MTLQTLERKLRPFQEPLQSSLLRWLYLHLPPQPITSRQMHSAYAKAVSILMRERELGKLSRANQIVIGKYLSSLIPFIEEYEKKEFSIGSATPEEVLRFLMEQNDLSQYDLAGELGGQSVVSDILHGKRKLTREHIERISRRFHISPATFYQAAA